MENNWIPVTESLPENGVEVKVRGFSTRGTPKEDTAFYHPAIGWFGGFNGTVKEWQPINVNTALNK